ncbi:hypothetical protein MesoLj113a_24200 [Mesorhizobium sp. 113-1-2]|nr:hypothetical protein MesoLj113a_24200 [Mesorhizobium sp. 113-1-2]
MQQFATSIGICKTQGSALERPTVTTLGGIDGSKPGFCDLKRPAQILSQAVEHKCDQATGDQKEDGARPIFSREMGVQNASHPQAGGRHEKRRGDGNQTPFEINDNNNYGDKRNKRHPLAEIYRIYRFEYYRCCKDQ